ncbi:MAG: cell envelope integrity protein TolA [Pirellulales bacterium]|nr:cell envelope integrity protein TolA [Pirellulales bacterium]
MYTEQSRMPWKGRNLVHLTLMVSLLFFLAGCTTTMDQQATSDEAFIDDVEYLSAYGMWADYPAYGQVWRPHVVSDWEPFYYGHWIWTDNGWAWTSYEPYGWLVYHYGNWGYEPGFGWFWVPGDTWYPARVQWYTFGNYAAWAPYPPPSMMWPDPWDPYDVNIWIVVDINDFTNENIGRHRIKQPVYRDRVWSKTVVRQPPDVKQVERAIQRTVRPVRVRERETTIRSRAVSDQPATIQRNEQTPKRVVTPETEKRKVDSKQPATVQRKEQVLKKMVLPQPEKRKVEKHAPQVKREVLKSREKAPAQQKKTQDKSADPKRKRK